MRRLKKACSTLLAVLLAAGLMAVPPCIAWAEDENDVSIGTLSDRYQSLESLETATDDSDNVVTSTRIGVLTGSNRAIDGDTVSFSGEVVGDIMNGDSTHKWLNVLGSDGSCIGVWVDNDMADRIINVGDYATTGTKIQVRGIYSIDCEEHQGELDVHALDLKVLDSGGSVTHYSNDKDIYIGFLFFALGFVLLMVFFGVRMYIDRRDIREERLRHIGVEAEDFEEGKRKRGKRKGGTEE